MHEAAWFAAEHNLPDQAAASLLKQIVAQKTIHKWSSSIVPGADTLDANSQTVDRVIFVRSLHFRPYRCESTIRGDGKAHIQTESNGFSDSPKQ